MNKFFKALGYILGIIWLLVLAFFNFGIFSAFRNKDGSLTLWVILIAVWWVLFTAVMMISVKISKKNRYRLTREYREKNISNVVISDDYFGLMVFEYDMELKTLDSKNVNLPPFGADSPSTLEIYGYSEDDRSRIFENLRELYNHADALLEQVYLEFLKTCPEHNEPDKDAKPCTLETLRGLVYAEVITVTDGGRRFDVEFWNNAKFGERKFIAHVDFEKGISKFVLEE